jgi:hypothetical protein
MEPVGPTVAPEASPEGPSTTEAQGVDVGEGSAQIVAGRHEDLREMEEIEEFEALAKVLDDTETCPECGAVLGPEDMRCSGCGAEFDIEMECPACKARLDPADRRCPGCGIEFVE